MMKRRIYADTSVIGGCVDAEFEKASQLLMETTEDAVVLANLYIDAGAIGEERSNCTIGRTPSTLPLPRSAASECW